MQEQSLSQPELTDIDAIKALRISIASPEQIRSWSSGEVTKAETMNYRTLKPEPGGLFCERIFGPTKNWTCACEKYVNFKSRTKKACEKCGVPLGSARMRRTRMGHIELAAPVCHIWFARAMPSRIGLLLDLSQREMESILTYTHYIVVSIDAAARLDEVQRLTAEIECLERSQHKTEALSTPFSLFDSSVSQQDRVLVLASARQREGLNHENSTAKTSSALDLQIILRDLSALASFNRGEITSNNLEPGKLFSYKGEGGEDPQVPGQEEWEPRHSTQRIRELQRVKVLLTRLIPLSLLEIEEYRLLRMECGRAFQGESGAEAIEMLLKTLNLEQIASDLRRKIQDYDGPIRAKAVKRLKVVEALRRSGTRPEWMVLRVIPILPPDLRPVLSLDGGRFAASDINELYCRVIHRNNRLKHFLEIDAPDLMIFREKQALQAACDALFDNGHLSHPLLGPHRQVLRSLTDSLSGKNGLFRHNLLGKRVDYSGRSVISVGLDLKMHQCGLPKKIALELFKQFIIQKLVASRQFLTQRQARLAVERKDPAVWDMLDEVMRDRVVLLNRAPTLHRLSIQAFEPVLVEGNAIRLHPQVCSAFNADFDGDQMAVHLPLTLEAQKEARELMLSTRNLLSPASGEPSISIAQEQVLGCYYLTQERPNKKGEGRIFSGPDEAIQAYNFGVIDLQARITLRLENDLSVFDQPPPAPPLQLPKGARVQTTAGRLLFNEALPERLSFRNYAMKKDFLKQLIWDAIKSCGMEETAVMADAIKQLGFHHATRAAISFSIADVKVPPQKKDILARADQRVEELREEWRSGLITREELYQHSIDIWQQATDQIAQHVQEILDPYGPLTTIANSGATKAKLQQIRQLSGMRGLMASPSGAIIEIPVRGNFLEGLSVVEYFLSSHGARKSMMDRSLNTAQSGYLTIQFVNAAQEVIVTEEDCGTQEGLLITEADSRDLKLPDNSSRLIGRVLAEDLPAVGLTRGDELDDGAVERIAAAGIKQVRVRSVLYCQTRRGVCRACYGWDLSRRARVVLGAAVGIIAAQSIGEPGTQLTMRTFHSGGIAGGQGDITQGIPRVKELFNAYAPKVQAISSETEGVVTMRKNEKAGTYTVQVTSGEQERGGVVCTYSIPADRKPVVRSGQQVRAGDVLSTGSRNPHALLEYQGREALALYLLKEAQQVYRTTGVYIHDKHFEIIIRQMLRYVRVNEPGDTQLLPGDLIDRLAYQDVNTRVIAQGGQPATARAVLLGLIPATLATESWLAAASFQQTSRVLTDAALEGGIDYLRGLKENVIVGKLIPAGTGILPRPKSAKRKASGRRGRPAKQKAWG